MPPRASASAPVNGEALLYHRRSPSGHSLGAESTGRPVSRKGIANEAPQINARLAGRVCDDLPILGDASYGLRLGAAQGARDGGLLGFVLLTAPTT
jgi:hypothetical protein